MIINNENMLQLLKEKQAQLLEAAKHTPLYQQFVEAIYKAVLKGQGYGMVEVVYDNFSPWVAKALKNDGFHLHIMQPYSRKETCEVYIELTGVPEDESL